MRSNRKRGPEICVRTTQQIVCTPHNEGDHQRKKNRTAYADNPRDDRRKFRPAFDALLLLLRAHVRGLRALLNLLGHELTPINPLIDREAHADAEQCQQNNRNYPARLSNNVFKCSLRRKKHANDPANSTDCRLRLRVRRGQGRSCSHRGSSTTKRLLQAPSYRVLSLITLKHHKNFMTVPAPSRRPFWSAAV